MAVKQLNSGKWQADFRPEGRGGKRIACSFRTKREALDFELTEKAKARTRADYSTPDKDKRRLSDLAQSWYDEHGHQLGSGKKRLGELLCVIEDLDNPLAIKFSSQDFLTYRRKRYDERKEKGFQPENDLNHKLAYVKAMFSTLIKSGTWKHANPVGNVPKMKMQERELSYLTKEQIPALLSALESARNPDVLVITKICLSTGARWGEAEGLHHSNVKAGQIHFLKTKNGRNRSIPISKDLEREVLEGRPKQGPLFVSAWAAFREGLERAAIELPRGQKAHVLRHTFASHFMMNGGNLLTLNKILGHQTVQMTMRYAHLAPEHLADALKLNPMVKACESGDKAKAAEKADE